MGPHGTSDGTTTEAKVTAFEAFFRVAEPLLGKALAAGFGFDTGHDAAAVALATGWRNWDRVQRMTNPTGYLYRVGENWARRSMRRRGVVHFPAVDDVGAVSFEPGLGPALAALPRRQRQAVVLVTGFGLSHREAAELLGVSRSAIQNHVERGLRHLRDAIGASE